MFGFVIPNKTAQKMRARENIKPVMRSKLFPVFDIILMHDQNNFQRFGVISPTRDESLKTIKVYTNVIERT